MARCKSRPTPWPTPARLVPPSPTPRAVINTPVGSSNLDAIINERTLTIGWIGPALLGILIAAADTLLFALLHGSAPFFDKWRIQVYTPSVLTLYRVCARQ